MYGKYIAFSFLTTAGLGGGLVGTHYSTQETIKDNLLKGEKFLEKDGASEGWTYLVKKIKESGSTDSEEFSSIKKNSEKILNESELYTSCNSYYTYTYKNFFKETKGLLNDFKNFCTVSFGDLVTKEKQLSDNNKKVEKLNNLKQHSDQSEPKLNKSLNDLKHELVKAESDSNEDNNWKKLVSACQTLYKEYFTKEDDNWKSTKKYCSTDN